jgi:GNAT superfamily N-acetyltransferase
VSFTIRQAAAADAALVSGILREAAQWLIERGDPLWRDDELRPERIAADVERGLYFLAANADEAIATFRFQLEDPEFWPDLPAGEAAYVHRLAVRRSAAGAGVSLLLLQWALERTRALARPYLRLDTEASRLRLRAVYERFGFRHHSDRQVGPYYVARYQYRV